MVGFARSPGTEVDFGSPVSWQLPYFDFNPLQWFHACLVQQPARCGSFVTSKVLIFLVR